MEIELSYHTPNSINTLKSSIDNLTRTWNRRKRWQLVFHCCYIHDTEENFSTRAPWRAHLASFLESTPIHLLSLSLLLFDLVLTVLDLSSSLLSCSSSKKRNRDVNLLYHWGGIAILIMLSTKTAALIVALGRSFFRRPGQVVDGLVVIGALVLEALVKGEGGGLLLVVSLWRVVRVVESTLELSDEAIEAQINGIVCEFAALKDENQRLREDGVEKDERIAELEEALSQLGKGTLHGRCLSHA